jgi:N-acetylmuramoyl-L-alanine amidase
MALLAAVLQNTPAQTPAPQAPATQSPAPQAPAAPQRAALGTIVIDAAHGGTDSGARGGSGVVEKDVVALLAQAMRGEMERQGLRVVLTRTGDKAPSFDDRASIANAIPGAIFVSLHVASSGPAGTAIAYSLPQPPAAIPGSAPKEPPPPFLVPWKDAQLRYASESRRLAELLQIQLAQKCKGSPEIPRRSAVRQLRLVGHPAVAVEIASVAVEQPKQLERMAPALAEALVRAFEAFRLSGEAARP